MKCDKMGLSDYAFLLAWIEDVIEAIPTMTAETEQIVKKRLERQLVLLKRYQFELDEPVCRRCSHRH